MKDLKVLKVTGDGQVLDAMRDDAKRKRRLEAAERAADNGTYLDPHNNKRVIKKKSNTRRPDVLKTKPIPGGSE